MLHVWRRAAPAQALPCSVIEHRRRLMDNRCVPEALRYTRADLRVIRKSTYDHTP